MIYSSTMTIDKARQQISELEARLAAMPDDPSSVERNAVKTEINTVKLWLSSREAADKKEQAIQAATGIFCGNSEKYLADLISHRAMVARQLEDRIPAYKPFLQQDLDRIDAQIQRLQEAIANAK